MLNVCEQYAPSGNKAVLYRKSECVRFVRGLADARGDAAAMENYLQEAKDSVIQIQLVRTVSYSRRSC